MVKVFVMSICPDCFRVKAMLKDHPNFMLVDIGEHVRNLKAFLHLRDSHPAFEPIKAMGAIGIPCYVTEEGDVSFAMPDLTASTPKEEQNSPLSSSEAKGEGRACSLDGKGC